MAEQDERNTLVKCINIRTGREVEMPLWVTRDKGHMAHLELEIKPAVQKLTKKSVILKIQEAKTLEELAIIMDGEDREDCIKAAEEKKTQLTK